ncbi:MAG: HAD family hydrolase [Deltaproteobacteria bacterium]|nr:HAD family hydrolase [Deltaproteobacteria bacterium]
MTRYVFDFDGVLFDTARECLAVAYAAVHGLAAEPPPEVAERFLANRHWVGPPWQYALLLECIERGELPRTTSEFLTRAELRRAELEGFTASYFAARGALAKDVARWCAAIAPTPALAAYHRLHAAGRATILSTRDDVSIAAILGHLAGIADPVLLPRAGAREKWELLLEHAARCDVAPRRVFFLDDYAHHAVPAHHRGVAAHLATWGYLGPDDLETARTAGLPCLALGDLDRALERHEQEHPP